MKNSKHTPGPWILSGGRVESEQGAPIARAYREMSDFPHNIPVIYPVERDANMRLCSVAPEMLEFLKKLALEADSPKSNPLAAELFSLIERAEGGGK